MSETVLIGFGGGLRGEEVLLASLKRMLQLWDETRLRRNKSYVMITLKGRLER